MARKAFNARVEQINRLMEVSSELCCIMKIVGPRLDVDMATYIELAKSDDYDLASRNREMKKMRRLYNDCYIEDGTLYQSCPHP